MLYFLRTEGIPIPMYDDFNIIAHECGKEIYMYEYTFWYI